MSFKDGSVPVYSSISLQYEVRSAVPFESRSAGAITVLVDRRIKGSIVTCLIARST